MSGFPPEKVLPRAKYERWLVEDETYYNYPDLVWTRCWGSDKQAKAGRAASLASVSPKGTSYSAREATIRCQHCEFEAPKSEALPWAPGVDDWTSDKLLMVKPPEHERLLTIYEQADEVLFEIAEALGFQKRDDVVLHATYNATKRERQEETLEGMVAVGMDELTRALVRRAAVKDASRAASKLVSFKLESNWAAREASEKTYNEEGPRDGVPFFSESVLYPLLGKEEARTVLAYVSQIARATSATAEDHEEED